MENYSAKLLLRTCKPSFAAQIEGYRLAIESHGMPDIILADVKISQAGLDFIVTEGAHNRMYREPVLTGKDRTEVARQAYAHIEEIANSYSSNLGMKLEEVKD